MKSKRRPTTPITLLTQIEALLSDAVKGLSSIEKSVEKNVRVLLLSAATSVAAAKNFITPAFATATPHKRPRARKRAGRRLRPARSSR